VNQMDAAVAAGRRTLRVQILANEPVLNATLVPVVVVNRMNSIHVRHHSTTAPDVLHTGELHPFDAFQLVANRREALDPLRDRGVSVVSAGNTAQIRLPSV